MARSHTIMREFVSNLGALLGISEARNLVQNGLAITRPAVDATITVSAEGATVANQRDIVIQLKDSEGRNIDYAESVDLIVYVDAAGLDFVVTGGSTGIAVNGASPAGKLLALVAKKVFAGITNASGALNVIWTDTGTEAAFLGVTLPNGRVIMSSALTNA